MWSRPIGTVSKKVLVLHVRAKPALCSHGITRIVEIFTRVHEKHRPGVIARKYVCKNVGNVLIIHQLAPPLSLLVPPPLVAAFQRSLAPSPNLPSDTSLGSKLTSLLLHIPWDVRGSL